MAMVPLAPFIQEIHFNQDRICSLDIMRRASNVIVQITENLQDVKNNVNSISHQQSRSFGLCTTIIPLTYLPSWNRNFCVMSVSGYISTHIWDDFFCFIVLCTLRLLYYFRVLPYMSVPYSGTNKITMQIQIHEAKC